MTASRTTTLSVKLLSCLLTLLLFTGISVTYSAPQGSFGSSTRTAGTELEGKIYYLPENTEMLPNFDLLKPIGSIYTSVIDVAPRSFEEGFPGVSERIEWFGIVYTGKFGITRPGQYQFRLISDDGSKLFIDGKQVINNDGVHPPNDVDGSISLSAGNHTIRVEYFQGPRFDLALQLFIAPQSGEMVIFSTNQYPAK
jgi:hypothetical protein